MHIQPVFVRLSDVVANERTALKCAVESRIGTKLEPTCFGGRLKEVQGEVHSFKGHKQGIVKVPKDIFCEAREFVVKHYHTIELEPGAASLLRYLHEMYGDVRLVSDFCAPRTESTATKVRRIRRFLEARGIGQYVHRVLLDGHQGFNTCHKNAVVVVDNDWKRLNEALAVAKKADGIYYRAPARLVGGEVVPKAPYVLPRITEVHGWETYQPAQGRAA